MEPVQKISPRFNGFYVYIHYRKDDGKPFYIGKGRKYRPTDCCNRSSYWQRVVSKHGLRIKVIAGPMPNDKALALESRLIRLYRNRKHVIVNHTDGGEGITGFRFSEESRKKMSDSRKGRVFHPGYSEIMRKAKTGIKFTEEHKRNLAAAIKASWIIRKQKLTTED